MKQKISQTSFQSIAQAVSKVYPIETGAGLLTVEISGDHVRVDMGAPKLGPKTERLDIGSSVVSFRYISMGNPHAVILVESLDGYPVEIEGPVMEKHPRFPKRTNLEFVEVIKAGAQESSKSQRNARANSKSSKAKVKVRVWE